MRYVPDRFLTAADLGATPRPRARRTRPSCSTPRPASRSVPNGSLGFRYTESGKGRWNLDLGGRRPGADACTARTRTRSPVDLPRFDVGETEGGAIDPPRGAGACGSAAGWSPPCSTC